MMNNAMVWCVVCVEPGALDIVHIFSTPEKAAEFCEQDHRSHVTYDYVVDCPERMEQPSQ
jgi:hypothetical protein